MISSVSEKSRGRLEHWANRHTVSENSRLKAYGALNRSAAQADPSGALVDKGHKGCPKGWKAPGPFDVERERFRAETTFKPFTISTNCCKVRAQPIGRTDVPCADPGGLCTTLPTTGS